MNNARFYQTVCGYVRSSVSDDFALVRQSVQIMTFCVESDRVLVRTVFDRTSSGRQPKLSKLLDRATSPQRPYDLFVISSESRLSRDPAKIKSIKDRLKAADVALVVLDQPLNLRLIQASLL